MKIHQLTLAAALLTFATSSILALTVPVAEDTSSTAAGKLTPAAGKSMSMAVNSKQTAFIRFNLSDPAVVPSAIVPGNIVSATLRVFVESVKNPGDLTVHVVTSAWTENPATPIASEPTIDAMPLTTIPAAEVKKEQFISVDVTAAVQAALDVNDFGFAIQTASAAKVLLGTKEGPALGYAAVLEIEANLAGSTTGDISVGSLSLGGTLTLPDAGSATDIIYAGTVSLLHDFGTRNFFSGLGAGNFTMTGTDNTGSGAGVLAANTTGTDNTGLGSGALASNTAGSGNSAFGNLALNQNIGGNRNTALGYAAMQLSIDGTDNTAVGFGALINAHPGGANVGVGNYTLNYNTGNHNTALGYAALTLNNTGPDNTAVGYQALALNQDSAYNTAVGSGALFTNGGVTGSAANDNTAVGYQSLYFNTNGFDNTAVGFQSLYHNIGDSNGPVGHFNTAVGSTALYSNTTGYSNTALGNIALFTSTTSSFNTAIGDSALYRNENGNNNVAVGYSALERNTDGYFNTAVGSQALASDTTGAGNTGLGYAALGNLSGGSDNTAVGDGALGQLGLGVKPAPTYNIAIGVLAGYNITDGDYCIDIGNQGTASDSHSIRIGDSNQGATFIAGIYGPNVGVNGLPVYVNAAGQLGTNATSSRRFKMDIADMDAASDVLLSMRPVTFRYKPEIEPVGSPQFGLIAEEVAALNPDLVVRDPKGEIFSVRYDAVNAMLLNEFLKEHRRVEEQEHRVAEQEKQIGALTARLALIEHQLEKLITPVSADPRLSAK